MPRKKVAIATKPTEKPANVDDWVTTPRSKAEPVTLPADTPKVKMKRLTLDIPEPLHKAIKSKSVEEGVSMADMLRELLEENFY